MKNKSRNVLYRPFKYILTGKFADWIKKSMYYRINMIEGTIRSGKDQTAAVAFVEKIKMSRDNVFLVAGVTQDRAFAIVGQYILDYCADKAIKTKYNDTTAIKFVYKGKTNFIMFVGAYQKNSQDFIQGLTLGAIYMTEINLLNPDFITQAFNRIVASEDPAVFGTLNPMSNKHWFYQQFMNLWEAEGKNRKRYYNYLHTQLSDNPIMTPDKIELTIAGRDPNTVSYKRDILGLRADPEGAVYNLSMENYISNDWNPLDYLRYSVVMDLGESRSATAFTLGAIYDNVDRNQKELHILKEYHHVNNEVMEQFRKTPDDYLNDYVDFIVEAIEKFGKFPEYIIVDGTREERRDVEKKLSAKRLGHLNTNYPPKLEEESLIYLGQTGVYSLKLRFARACNVSIDQFRETVYDDKYYESTGKIRRLAEYNIDGHYDNRDNVDYLLAVYRNILAFPSAGSVREEKPNIFGMI